MRGSTCPYMDKYQKYRDRISDIVSEEPVNPILEQPIINDLCKLQKRLYVAVSSGIEERYNKSEAEFCISLMRELFKRYVDVRRVKIPVS